MNSQEHPVLELDHVSKTFGGKAVVDDVSFSIQKGEIVGFLGPNGAGKTTSLRMALGLIAPDRSTIDGAGGVRLFGQAPGPKTFGRIGFLPEERGLYRKITAREAIAHIAMLNGMGGKAALKRADEMLDRYGLGDAKRKKIKTLSKGMAQKVQLIAAIAHDPEFLILDEPFSGLDPVNQKLLEDMVREIAERGRTILFSTHVMEHAERLCDRIILMSSGAKIFDGSVQGALSCVAPFILIEVAPDQKKQSVDKVFGPLCTQIETRSEGQFALHLEAKYSAADVLSTAHKSGLLLSRFQPHIPSLHDAFVSLVGADATEISDKNGARNA